MIRLLLKQCFSFLLCFSSISSAYAEPPKAYFRVGDSAFLYFTVQGAQNSLAFEFPGRPYLENLDRFKGYANPSRATLSMRSLELEDSGIITCLTSEDRAEIELVVYETSECEDLQVEPVSKDTLSVSWKRPAKYPELIVSYSIVAFERPQLNIKSSTEVKEFSENGVESHYLNNVPSGNYHIAIRTYYKHGQKSDGKREFSRTTVELTREAWDGPELSLRASALTPDTVLVSLQTLDSENIIGLELTYSDGTIDQKWKQFAMDEKDRFAVVENLLPGTTYYFKAKAELRLGLRDAVTHVITPPDGIPTPSAVKVQPTRRANFIKVTWSLENPDEVKGYKVTVEKRQLDQSYRVQSQHTTAKQELDVARISSDAQYRITLRAFGLGGLGEPSEPVFYPESPQPITAAPVTCPSQPVSDAAEEGRGSFKLDVRAVRQTPSRVRIMWFLPSGDLDEVRKFQITLTSGSGRILLTSKLWKNQRSINLRPIPDKLKYLVTIKALDSQENVLVEKTIDVPPKSSEKEPSKPELVLEASEIRGKQARLLWALRNVEPKKLKSISLTAQKDGPDGEQVTRRTLATNRQTIVLSKLPANSVFFITVEAIGHDNKPFLSSVLTLKTPSHGHIGQPVTGTPLISKQAFHKKQGVLKLLSFNIRGGEASLTWEDEGEPIPEDLRKDAKVLAYCKRIFADGRNGPLKAYVSEPGARSLVLKDLERYGKYQVRVKYFDSIPGVEDINVWSEPLTAEEML